MQTGPDTPPEGGESAASAAARFARLESLFNAALPLNAAARQHYLDTHCADAAERAELEALLAADQGADTQLSRVSGRVPGVLSQALDGVLPTPTDAMIGERIGPWRVTGVLGQGGMGTVYAAERDDGAYQQRVALKLIRSVGASPVLMQRFVAERQILARLDHPGIARLLDGGEWRGIPWLAMERVEGLAIDAWCAGRSLQERLTVFRAVCAAVEYAHQNLVIHRDIKPSNILVDVAGQPHLLDFGIAKLLDEETASEQTRTQFSMLTPEYASPEQLLGRAVTTASDVYSLGVLLYRLLTGGRLRTEGASEAASALVRTADDVEITRPSRAAALVDASGSGRALAQQLRGDLDAIVLKALRYVPAERYRSVEALDEDVFRYQSLQPVLARREGAGYVFGKFARRHWRGLAATVVVVTGIVALVSFYTARLNAERRDAQHAAEQARLAEANTKAVADFMIELITEADPDKRKQGKTLQQVLEQGSERVAKDLAAQPLVAARLQSALGQAWAGLGEYERGVALLADAQARYERALGALSEPALQARMDRARALSGMRQYQEAYALLREAQIQVEQLARPPSAVDIQLLLALTYSTQNVEHRSEELLAMLDRARTALATLDASQVPALLAEEAQQRCRLLGEFRHVESTLRECRRSVDLDIALVGEHDIKVGKDWLRLARAAMDTGDLEIGRDAVRRARAVYQQYYQPDNRQWSNLNYLEHALCITQGDYACAGAYSAPAAAPLPATADRAERSEYTRRFVARLFLLGEARDVARADAAMAILAQQPEAAFGGEPYLSSFEYDFIPYWVQLSLGRPAAALQHAEAYLDWVRKLLGEADRNTAKARLFVAIAAMAMQPPQIERARALSEQALNDAREEFTYAGSDRAEWLTLQAQLNKEAAPALEALEIWRRQGVATGLTVRTLNIAADLLPPNDTRVAAVRAEAAAIVARARAAVEATSSRAHP